MRLMTLSTKLMKKKKWLDRVASELRRWEIKWFTREISLNRLLHSRKVAFHKRSEPGLSTCLQLTRLIFQWDSHLRRRTNHSALIWPRFNSQSSQALLPIWVVCLRITQSRREERRRIEQFIKPSIILKEARSTQRHCIWSRKRQWGSSILNRLYALPPSNSWPVRVLHTQ